VTGQAVTGQAVTGQAVTGQAVTGQAVTGPALARSVVDRATHRRTDAPWLDAAWSRARVLVVDPSGRTLVGEDPGGGVRLVFVDAPGAPDGERLFLGVDAAGTPYFAVVAGLPDIDGARSATLRQVGAALPDRDSGLFVTAVALANWHATHRYSPVTGQPTTVAQAGWVRTDGAGTQLFPRTDPAMIVLVHDGVAGPPGRCLLGTNAAWPVRDGRRFFSILAGFVEPGESIEAAVTREVYEEVGVRVSAPRYEASQAWPFPGSLMVGFTAVADPVQPLRLDPSEIVDARWFSRGEVAALLSHLPGGAGGLDGAGGGVAGGAGGGAEVTLPGPASIAHFLLRLWVTR
jgi:NAD+ diphosphatase